MHELYAHRGCASCDMVLRHLIAHLDKSSWTNEKKKRGKPQNVNLVIVWESLGKNCLKTSLILWEFAQQLSYLGDGLE